MLKTHSAHPVTPSNPPPNHCTRSGTLCSHAPCCYLTQPVWNLHEYHSLPSLTLLPAFLNWLFNLGKLYELSFPFLPNGTFSVQLANLSVAVPRVYFSTAKAFSCPLTLPSPSFPKCPLTFSTPNVFFLPFSAYIYQDRSVATNLNIIIVDRFSCATVLQYFIPWFYILPTNIS